MRYLILLTFMLISLPVLAKDCRQQYFEHLLVEEQLTGNVTYLKSIHPKKKLSEICKDKDYADFWKSAQDGALKTLKDAPEKGKDYCKLIEKKTSLKFDVLNGSFEEACLHVGKQTPEFN